MAVSAHCAEPAAVLQHIAADEPKADFVVAPGPRVELGEAAVGAVFGEHPIERAGPGDDPPPVRPVLPPERHESNAGSSTVSARCTAAS